MDREAVSEWFSEQAVEARDNAIIYLILVGILWIVRGIFKAIVRP